MNDVYDVVGIGFGPANLALGIALREAPEPLTAAFFDRQPGLGWHRGMLVPSAKMQVSFLKDLATFRNPLSSFSFVHYLHEAGRLASFVNNQDFFPTRREFHDYLEWAAARLALPVHFGTEATAIRLPPPAADGAEADWLEVEVREAGRPDRARAVRARNVVIGTGLVPMMPAGVQTGDRVWHSSQFLTRFRAADPARLRHVAVAGAGQSAAEIVRFLYDHLPEATVHAILPSYGYVVADDTPFANRVFDPAATDDYYFGSEQSRNAFWRYHRTTNYAVVDSDLIRDLYRRSYDDQVAGVRRLELVNLSRVDSAKQVGEQVRITVHSTARDESHDLVADLLVCATGYDPMDPGEILGPLADRCRVDAEGRLRVGRDHRLLTDDGWRCGVYLQGGTEHTHGLSSSLLSNIAVRAGEIVDSITAARPERKDQQQEGVRT